LCSGVDVALLNLYMTARPCLTTVDHFENMEGRWFSPSSLSWALASSMTFFMRLACKCTIFIARRVHVAVGYIQCRGQPTTVSWCDVQETA
jgi:hypothetical protein